jgi:peroxiredoxin
MKKNTPVWIQRTLFLAGLYNILWGAWVVLFPNAQFDLLGMPHPNYPQFWQCIGMIVGVYGIGYAIAATDPARHWPIVLVGFLGKIFGPLGMVQALWTGALPLSFAINCLFNDAIWWVPFALALRYAWREHLMDLAQTAVLPSEADALAQAKVQNGKSIAELSREKPVLLVFLHHAGCTFCREALADLTRDRARIEGAGSQIALVHMGTPESFAAFAGSYGLDTVPAVSDPDRVLYRALGLRRGSMGQLLGLKVWVRGAQAFFKGHGIGALQGDGTQMPGTFLVYQGKVIARYLHRTAADRPDYTGLCKLPSSP